MSDVPVGNDPVEIDGIILRRSEEIPMGMQALWDAEGKLLAVGLIGADYKGPPARTVTVNPIYYEVVRGSKAREEARERIRRRYGGRRLHH